MLIPPQEKVVFMPGYDSFYGPSEKVVEVEEKPAQPAGRSVSWMDDFLDHTVSFVYDYDYTEAVDNSEKFYDNDRNLVVGLTDQERRDKRMAHCGESRLLYDKASGLRKYKHIFCSDMRCPHCFGQRKKKFQDDIMAMSMANRDLRSTELPEEEATALCRKIGKDNFKRYPLENGNDFVIYYDPEDKLSVCNINSKEMSYEVYNSLDFEQIARTRKGKKVSGSLTKSLHKPVVSAPPEDDTKKELVYSISILTDHQKDLEDKADLLALKETKDLDPKTGKELSQAIMTRSNAFMKHYCALGGHIISTNLLKEQQDMSKVDWITPILGMNLDE